MVRRLLGRDGAKGIAGEPLIELDPTRANANVEIYRRRLYATQAALARYQAEAAGHRTLRFPDALLARADAPDIRAAMMTEAALFDARTADLGARRDVQDGRASGRARGGQAG